MSTMTVVQAINEGLRRAMREDPRVVVAGEDVGRLGGVFRVTQGLQDEFGSRRVFDSPLAESSLIAAGLGLALHGHKPVIEIQFNGFVFPAFDQIVSQVAKLRARTHGRANAGIVIRIPAGGGIGSVEHHSESPESYFCHTPGLRVVSIADAQDGYWVTRQAIECPDPVIVFEPLRRYHDKGTVHFDTTSAKLDQAIVRRPGTDATLICHGAMVRTCMEAAAQAEHEGRSLEVIDLHSLAPIDYQTLTASVARTRRAIVVHEAHRTLGIGAEIAARLQEDLFFLMDAPVLRVTSYDLPHPPSRLDSVYLPSIDRVLDAVDRSFEYQA